MSMPTAAGLSYRKQGEPKKGTVLFVHGYPESSYMWRHVLPEVAREGWAAIAPDLPGYGDSPLSRPGTWEDHMEALHEFVSELDLPKLVLVTHDWGVPIGLRCACEHPAAIRALVISDGGFFSDRRWHDLANVMRTPGEGEQLISSFTREGWGQAVKSVSSGMTDEALDEYWKAFSDEEHRLAHLALYRSGDFEKLVPYEGRVAQLGVPTLIVWGADDRFASPKMAYRFAEEIPDSRLRVIDGAGHFVWEDAPQPANAALLTFLAELPPPSLPS